VNNCVQASETCCDVRDLVLPPKEKYPIPPGQQEFVPMDPEEAAVYRKNGNGQHPH